jgi:type IV pilus assembly protein PilM
MALFNIGKTKAYLGVDIGAAGIKLVQLNEEKGRPKLHTYGYTVRTPAEMTVNPLDAPAETAAVLKAMVKKAKTTVTQVVTGLPISAVFSSVISVPKISEKEQRGVIEVQARKLISIPLEEMILDSKILTTPEEEKAAEGKLKSIKVLLTAAPKLLVKKYLDVFKGAGLELASLETEAFALIRSLVGKDKATLMVVDIGSMRTSVLVVVGGVPYLSRSIDVGGLKFTKAAATALGVPDDQAEGMKTDIRAFGPLAEGGVAKVFEPVVRQIANEISFSLKLFAGLEDAQGKTVEKIILTGGGSMLPGLDTFLAGALGTRVFRGDPWARILYPDDARPLLDEIGPRFSVAVGLGMRDFDS